MPITRGERKRAEVEMRAEGESDEEVGSIYTVDGEFEEGIATFGDVLAAVDKSLPSRPVYDGDRLTVRLKPVGG